MLKARSIFSAHIGFLVPKNSNSLPAAKALSMYNKAYNAAAQMCYHSETKHHANEGYIGCKYAFSHQSIYNWIIYQIYNQ